MKRHSTEARTDNLESHTPGALARQYGLHGLQQRSPNLPAASPTASTSSWVGAHFGQPSPSSTASSAAAAAAALGLPAETEISVVTDVDKREEMNRLFDREIQAKRARRETGDSDSVDNCGMVNYRADIGLDDKGLALISTKKLNRLIKEKHISKERAKEIKQDRRTLKNRGYAANCRVKRIDEENTLEVDIAELDRLHVQRQQEIIRLKNLIAAHDKLLEVESSEEEDVDYDDEPRSDKYRRALA